ncbi:hypothetical protein [Polyangium aurulentum]|uniref:hypothetical protein n=1 Tax=Polyangium aurulentum TaxID=2567896 RepID=UPI0010AE827A|nr:hypothetical protein [Polyangium aurulentum]UQA62746.1 hypothetical protein E8A73_020770 [Polyangium aurulentum]
MTIAVPLRHAGGMSTTSPRAPLARTFERGGSRWQIAYDDTGVLTQEGDGPIARRRGTDLDAILRGVDRAIAERLGSGWGETTARLGEDAPEAPVLDEAANARLHPLRRAPGPRIERAPEEAWAQAAALARTLRGYLEEAPEGADDAHRPAALDAVRWLCGDGPSPLPSDEAIALALFLLSARSWAESSATSALIDVVVGLGSAARATRALVLFMARCEQWIVLPERDDASAQHPGSDFARTPGPWLRVRAHLAHAPEPDYQAAREIALAARRDCPRVVAVALAYAFPDERGWANEDAAARERIRDKLAPERWLLTAVTDREALRWLAHDAVPLDVLWRARTPATDEALARTAKLAWPGRLVHVIGTLSDAAAPVDDVTLSMVAAAGDDAAPALVMLRDRAILSTHGNASYEVRLREAVFDALSRLPTASGIEAAVSLASYPSPRMPGALVPLLTHAETAPRRTLLALARNRLARPAHVEAPQLDRVAREIARRIDRASIAKTGDPALDAIVDAFFAPIPTETRVPEAPTNPLAAALDAGDAEALLEALATALPDHLNAALPGVPYERIAGLATYASALLDLLDARFSSVWSAVHFASELELARDNPQFATARVSSFLAKHPSEEAFARLLELLAEHAMIRDAENGLEAHVKRTRSKKEKAKRAGRIAAALRAAGEAEVSWYAGIGELLGEEGG